MIVLLDHHSNSVAGSDWPGCIGELNDWGNYHGMSCLMKKNKYRLPTKYHITRLIG